MHSQRAEQQFSLVFIRADEVASAGCIVTLTAFGVVNSNPRYGARWRH